MRNNLASLLVKIGNQISYFGHINVNKDCDWKCDSMMRICKWLYRLSHKIGREDRRYPS